MEIDAIVLAAGQGTRMAPLTNGKPKPLILYKGKPLLCWTLDAINNYVDNVIVVTKPFSEQYMDVPESYPKVRLLTTSSSTMLGAFWEAFCLTGAPYIFCGSSDVAYNPSVVGRLVNKIDNINGDAIVALKTSYVGGDKQWEWVIEDGCVRNVFRSTSMTSYERFCFLCKRDALAEFQRRMGARDGADTNQLAGGEDLGSGWVYLLGHLVDLGYIVKAEVMNEEWLRNVNRVSDLCPVD